MNRRVFLRSPASSPMRAKAVASIPEPAPLSISAGLEPYTAPLDRRHLDHLLRRVGFGVTLEERLHTFVGQTAAEVVDHLVTRALALPLPTPPIWADRAPPGPEAPDTERQIYKSRNRGYLTIWKSRWLQAMCSGGLRERMTTFWHNHFVTEVDVYELAPYAYRYLRLLRTHALGNFKDFVRRVGLDPAMLIYLNGNVNVAGAPNENYGRELLELFAMGPVDGQGNENYTQTDVVEIARALTGWVVNNQELSVAFDETLHDAGEKTIFGRTGPWGYDEVIDLVFEERAGQVAEFLARKLYREFVYTAPDEGVVSALAEALLAHDFEIAPVLRALLTSTHFFGDHALGAKIKSPVELLVSLMRELDQTDETTLLDLVKPFNLVAVADEAAQKLFNPPNVAGWPGHRDWITAETLTARNARTEQMLISVWVRSRGAYGMRHQFIELAKKLHPSSDPLAVFRLPVALAQHLMAVPVETLDIKPLTQEFAGDLISFPIPQEILDSPAYMTDLAKLFLINVPWYEWHTWREGADDMIFQYILALMRYPAFQLT